MLRGGPNARRVHPLRAARAAVLGKATAYAGALVFGWYAALTVRGADLKSNVTLLPST